MYYHNSFLCYGMFGKQFSNVNIHKSDVLYWALHIIHINEYNNHMWRFYIIEQTLDRSSYYTQ